MSSIWNNGIHKSGTPGAFPSGFFVHGTTNTKPPYFLRSTQINSLQTKKVVQKKTWKVSPWVSFQGGKLYHEKCKTTAKLLNQAYEGQEMWGATGIDYVIPTLTDFLGNFPRTSRKELHVPNNPCLACQNKRGNIRAPHLPSPYSDVSIHKLQGAQERGGNGQRSHFLFSPSKKISG